KFPPHSDPFPFAASYNSSSPCIKAPLFTIFLPISASFILDAEKSLELVSRQLGYCPVPVERARDRLTHRTCSVGRLAMLNRFTRMILVGLLSASAFYFAPIVQAQDRSASLQGVVKDAKRAPVTGAFVKLKNSERRLTFMIISQPQGRFSISALPSGKYVAQA